MDADGETATFVTDSDSIISMKRRRLDVAAFFDGIPVSARPSLVENAIFGPWMVQTLWNTELAGLAGAFGNARVVTLAVVPRRFAEGSNGTLAEGAVGVLYDSGLFVLVDPSRPRKAYFLLSFFTTRLEMLIAMVAVVFFFVGTETRSVLNVPENPAF
ncbi:hypothetical protein BC829DRAFT_443178 [Chytridium lagenaria]|nr:hypothetical protein BC829DRAFT_443178 [Chytridium lagenaria]